MITASAEVPAHLRLLTRLAHFGLRFRRGLTMGVRAVVLSPAGEVFLVRQTYTRGWHLPGGGIERGETAGAALARELVEEANLEITGEPTFLGIYFNARLARRDHVLAYVVREFRVRGPRPPDWEIAEARFFPLAALPDDVTIATAARIAEASEGRAPAPLW